MVGMNEFAFSSDPDTWPFQLDADLLRGIEAELEALGWAIDYSPGSEIEIIRIDPDSGSAILGGGAWLTWRRKDGEIVYGIGENVNDRDLKERLVLRGAADDPKVIAAAADQAIHMLWHRESRDLIARLYAENSRLVQLREAIRSLGNRMVVTPGQIRAALAECEPPK